MEEDLISKKEVLERYGISYGALYRWKRMGLIPEEWFIKKSAVTGQETFFDRAAITDRIESILSLKDTVSLEEIAKRLDGTSQTQNYKRILHIEWKYGVKDIPTNELINISVSDGTQSVDLTGILKETLNK